ncbi:MAG TPA: hypothetical protein VFR34_13930, partial [Paracoccaceae bacterium]|nr:hypothetical protein [Paracoccaceae bacterium]
MSQARAPGGWRLAGPALVIGAALLWALAETRDAMPPFAGAGAELLGRLYPPDAAALLPALDAALESVRIALLGTAAAAA